MKTVIYHRADFDGIFCREIARKFLPTADLIGWDYGDPVPVIPLESQLYMLDISVDGLMDYPGLIWIDHHKSAMEKFGTKIGYQIDGVAACRLAWQWFDYHEKGLDGHRNQLDPNLPHKRDYVDRTISEPLAVRLAGEYDIWDKRDPDAELFQHGLRSRELNDQDWKILLGSSRKPSIDEIERMLDAGHTIDLRPDGTTDESVSFVKGLLNAGEAIQYAKTQENEGIIKSYGFTLNFEGLCFLACNHARFNSHLFTAGIKPEHDALLGFNFSGTDWRVSLYHAPEKEHNDLSLIAVKYGGGGHKGACGFRMSSPSFLENL